jgi:hypothetical protein
MMDTTRNDNPKRSMGEYIKNKIQLAAMMAMCRARFFCMRVMGLVVFGFETVGFVLAGLALFPSCLKGQQRHSDTGGCDDDDGDIFHNNKGLFA